MNENRLFRLLRSWTRAAWDDQSGETSVMSLVLICTIVAIGATVGLTTFRDQLVQEFGDLAVAIENLDQSFDAGDYGSYVDRHAGSPPTFPKDNPNDPPDGIGFP